jgi:hypothetical protein
MCKKLISLICILVLASASFGSEVLYDFGSGLAGWNGGWGGLTLSDDTHGATLGTGSLKVVVNNGANFWWSGDVGKLTLTGSQVAKIVDHTYNAITIDVTRKFTDWTFAGNWWLPESELRCTMDMGMQNEEGEWAYPAAIDSMIGAKWYPTYLAGEPWNRPAETCNGPDDVTVRYNISLQPVWDLLATAATGGYIYNIDMGVHCMPIAQDYAGTTTYYVDNMQLIPEPATMALLGLGLALIRRKR